MNVRRSARYPAGEINSRVPSHLFFILPLRFSKSGHLLVRWTLALQLIWFVEHPLLVPLPQACHVCFQQTHRVDLQKTKQKPNNSWNEKGCATKQLSLRDMLTFLRTRESDPTIFPASGPLPVTWANATPASLRLPSFQLAATLRPRGRSKSLAKPTSPWPLSAIRS